MKDQKEILTEHYEGKGLYSFDVKRDAWEVKGSSYTEQFNKAVKDYLGVFKKNRRSRRIYLKLK